MNKIYILLGLLLMIPLATANIFVDKVIKIDTLIPQNELIQLETDPNYPCVMIDTDTVSCNPITQTKFQEISTTAEAIDIQEKALIEDTKLIDEKQVIEEPIIADDSIVQDVKPTLKYDVGIPIIDYRSPIYEKQNVTIIEKDDKGKDIQVIEEIQTEKIIDYKVQYIDYSKKQIIKIDLTKQGLIHIGYNSNIFNVTPINASNLTAGQNITITAYINNSFDLQQFNYTFNNSRIDLYTGLVAGYPFNNITGELNPLLDYSNNANTLINGGATYNQSGWYKFNGVNSYLNTGNGTNLNLSSSGTLSAWIKTTQTGYSVILGKMDYDSDLNGYQMALTNGALWLGLSNATAHSYFSEGSGFNDGNWHLATMTWNTSNRMYFYKDGINYNSDGPIVIPKSDVYNLHIGNVAFYQGSFFNGSIDDVRIYNRSLSASEVHLLYDLQLNKYAVNNESWNFTSNQNNLPNGTYNWSINYYDGVGYSFNNYCFNIGTGTGTCNATIPMTIGNITNLKNISQDNQSIYFNWTIGQNSTASYIYRNGINIHNETTNVYNDTGLLNNTCYNYTLIPYNGSTNGNNATLNNVCTSQNPPATTFPLSNKIYRFYQVAIQTIGLMFKNDNTIIYTCNATYESLQIYNFTSHHMQYCNSTAWITY